LKASQQSTVDLAPPALAEVSKEAISAFPPDNFNFPLRTPFD
jgi:hypothetical protein